VDEILGIERRHFDPDLLRLTEDLTAAVAAALELEAACVEPSHLLIALTRIPQGVASTFLSQRKIPPDLIGEAIRQVQDPPGGTVVTGLGPQSLAPATIELVRDLQEDVAASATIDERRLLGRTLGRLEQRIAELLARYGHIDTEQWATELLEPDLEPPAVFTSAGEVDLEVFSPAARRVLLATTREAAGLRAPRLTAPLLLYGLAVSPGGLLEKALQYLQHDLRQVRERLFAVLGAGPRQGTAELELHRDCMEMSLAMALERAVAGAAADRRTAVNETDLLQALLDAPGGVATTFLRDAGVDLHALLHFAATYYQEAEPEPTAAQRGDLSFEDALQELSERVVGQEAAVDQIVPYLESIKLGFRVGYLRDDRPVGVFLFCGPSGTGKTMTARVLARVLYGSDDAVLMFEMGQFNSKESINNFVGAPPGYVGFGEGKLTNGLRENPRRVLLFDEVEKADEKVFDALLRLLDEGRIDDPAGPVRDARESTIVLTSNLAAKELAGMRAPDGIEERQQFHARLLAILGQFFRPEFLNRVDETVLFSSFTEADLLRIAEGVLAREAGKAQRDLGVELTWAPDVPDFVVGEALRWRRDEAARGVRRVASEIVPAMLRLVDAVRTEGGEIHRVHVETDDGTLAVRRHDARGDHDRAR
jgi:ATP-dependent Clp protease ATP-binding subunit ClpA